MAKVVKVVITYHRDEEPPFGTADFLSPGAGGFFTRDRENAAFTPDEAGQESLETYLNGDYPENEIVLT